MSRQTKSFLIRRFREIGIQPASRHGQNFLIDLNLVRLIADSADLTDSDVVLEVGTGTGSLTALMAERAAAVVTVEIDRHLFELASEELLRFDNVRMLNVDALKNKNTLNQHVLDAVGEQLAAGPDRQFKLVANLPYNVATPILSNLLLTPHIPVMMVATIQKELAERIVASPHNKDYGALSVWVQSQCRAEIVRTLPPSVFWPAPKVESAIIRLAIDFDRRNQIPDLVYFHQFVKSLFLHRRKFLRANIQSALKRHATKDQVDNLLADMGFSADARTEQLGIDQLMTLTEKARELCPDWKL